MRWECSHRICLGSDVCVAYSRRASSRLGRGRRDERRHIFKHIEINIFKNRLPSNQHCENPVYELSLHYLDLFFLRSPQLLVGLVPQLHRRFGLVAIQERNKQAGLAIDFIIRLHLASFRGPFALGFGRSIDVDALEYVSINKPLRRSIPCRKDILGC